MSTIDIGGGVSVNRRHLPKTMLREFDTAAAAFSETQAAVRAWVKPLLPMQGAADDFSGTITCNAPGQSGLAYTLGEVGGALLVDQRDVAMFSKVGFSDVPSQQPTNPRVGLVFLDTATGDYLRWTGTAWIHAGIRAARPANATPRSLVCAETVRSADPTDCCAVSLIPKFEQRDSPAALNWGRVALYPRYTAPFFETFHSGCLAQVEGQSRLPATATDVLAVAGAFLKRG